jgi:hypothetical protein
LHGGRGCRHLRPVTKRDAALSAESAATPVRYAYRASLIGGAREFSLTDDGLAWRVGGKSGVWPYGSIAAIRLSYRPVSMQSQRFRADIQNDRLEKLAVLSTSWQTVALMAPQDDAYRGFIVALHQRLRDAGSDVALAGGLRPTVYKIGVAVIALLALAMTALLARAVATGEFYGALFLLGFVALFAWQIGGFIRRNQPRSYSLDDLPKSLLP